MTEAIAVTEATRRSGRATARRHARLRRLPAAGDERSRRTLPTVDAPTTEAVVEAVAVEGGESR